jgi:penicillin amidase
MVLMEELAEPFFRAYRLNGERRFKVGFVGQAEGPAWALATQRPPNLLDPRYKTWDEQLLHAVDTTIERILKDGGTLSQHTWGRLNTPKIQHPVSRALPFLARWLDMPRLPIPGDAYMPRVQDRVFGASERFAVSPGHEADGYFMMPCGESGHPLSPHYRDEHLDWVAGKPGSFLPGPVMETLRLVPEAPPRR